MSTTRARPSSRRAFFRRPRADRPVRPVGLGKTTLVDIVGGLIRPDRGRIAIDGQVLVDTERGVFVPKHRRRIGYVFQDSRLFPHLSVRSNLLYGRWFAGDGGTAANLASVVDLLGISRLLDRRPDSLSGGEKQRVAIGRALLAHPRALLMDEPLASLDEARRARSCLTSNGCATKRACRSSMSAIRWPRWRGWRPRS